MKFLTVLVFLMVSLSLNTANGASAVTYVGHDKVQAALDKGGPLVTAPDLLVQGSHRDKGGQVEVHDKETDVIHVIDGEATFVTGGTMVGGKSTKGDVIVVPAGMPHWFKEVPRSVSYFVVKVIKP